MHLYFKFLQTFLHLFVYLSCDTINSVNINLCGEKHHPVLFALMENLHSSFPIGFWLRECMGFEVLFQMRPLYDTRDCTPGQATRCGCRNHNMPTKMRSLWSQGFFWIRSVWPEPSLSVRSKENGKDKPQSALSVPLAETCDVLSFTL